MKTLLLLSDYRQMLYNFNVDKMYMNSLMFAAYVLTANNLSIAIKMGCRGFQINILISHPIAFVSNLNINALTNAWHQTHALAPTP